MAVCGRRPRALKHEPSAPVRRIGAPARGILGGVRDVLAVACLVLTGFAGLVYEVAWMREASQRFGSTTLAVSTVLAVFFLGLALGSAFFGGVAQRSRRPLRVFAALELGIAGLGLASLAGFAWVEPVYGALYRRLGPGDPGLVAARAALVAAVLLPPTVLMGGSLPLFCRHYVRKAGRIGRHVGGLYALHTLGAAGGAALAGAVLVPGVGLRGAVGVAALANALAAALVLAVPAQEAPPATAPARRGGGRVGTVGALFFAVGFVALGSQVLLTRFLALVVPHSVHTYTLVLTTALVGIVGGSLLAGSLADRVRSPSLLFGGLQVVYGLLLGAVLRLPPEAWERVAQLSPAVVAVLLLPPALLSGASFPVAIRMAVADPARAASGVGRMAALNTLGGIGGSLAVGLLLLPGVGLEASLRVLTALSLVSGAFAWLGTAPRRAPRAALVAAAVALWLLVPVALPTRVPADHLAPAGELVEVVEGHVANVAVVRKPDRLQLELDRFWQGQDVRNHQSVAAHVPMLLHPRPRSVLVVGVGAGQTARRFLLHEGVERLDCIDLEPAVFEVLERHFDGGWMDDPRVRRLSGDGLAHLAHTAQRYDVIALELGQLFRPGVAAAYTEDFTARAAQRLHPGGLLVQFVPLPFLRLEELRRVLASFLAVLPESVLWYNTAELLLVGRAGAELAMDPARLALLERSAALHADLAYAHWGGAEQALHHREVFLAGFLLGPAELAAFAAGAEPYSEDPPELEYALARLDPSAVLELESVAALRRHLGRVEAGLRLPLSPEAAAQVASYRERNLREIEASALVRRAAALRETQGLDEVEALVADAVERLPEHGVARRMEGELHALRGRHGEALAAFRVALRARPEDPAVRRGLGYALQGIDQPAEAAYHLRAALALGPPDAETHNSLGVALAEQGFLAEARRQFEEALRLDPGFEPAAANVRRAEAALGGR